ncbi:MAG: PKD domain-containing protein [Acidobacteriota bacterium]
MLRPKKSLWILLVLSLLVGTLVAQDRGKIKLLIPTHRGSTGLFNLPVADTFRQGEVALGVAAHKFNRDPGDIDYTIFPVSFTIGLTDRIELFGSMEAYKRVNADDIVVNKVLPRGALVPAVLNNNLPGGVVGFYNESPYMDVGFGDGTGDLWAGMKFNLLSERRGAGVSVAVQPIFKFHVTNDRQHLLRGLTSGSTDGGFDFILSKNISGGGTFTADVGYMWAGDRTGIDRQNMLNWGGGFQVPMGTPALHLIGEMLGTHFIGTSSTSQWVNSQDPIDAYLGLRAYASKSFALTGAVNYHLTGTDVPGVQDSECLGFYVQAALKRTIDEPPTVECSAQPTTVTEGDPVTINATMSDPDDDNLTVSWKTSGGRLSEHGNSATLDTKGLEAGRYSVMVEVSDGEKVASCSSDITVEKRKMPPTITCEDTSRTVTMGDSVTLRASASDPNGDTLTYSWTVDGQSVSNNSPQFEFGTTGRSVGQHQIRVTVTDVDNMSASCEFTVTVNLKPNLNPTCSLSLDRNSVLAGEPIRATAQASDPEGGPLTYAWQVDGQQRSDSGTVLSINTSGMTGGPHSVTLNVTDERGGTCTSTQTFNVTEKVIIPMSGMRPDNKAKAQLDEIALKMQQNPQLHARVTGYTDDIGSEANNEKVGMRRADAVKSYLVKQHNIDAGRIETQSGGESNPIADNKTAEGRKQNRRVEVELYVP